MPSTVPVPPRRGVREFLCMAFLLVPILDRSIRQDDVRMIGIVQLRRRKCLSCIDGNSLMDNDGPAIELPASPGGHPVVNIHCFRWRSHVETINRDLGLALRFQEQFGSTRPRSARCAWLRENTPLPRFSPGAISPPPVTPRACSAALVLPAPPARTHPAAVLYPNTEHADVLHSYSQGKPRRHPSRKAK